MKKTFVSLVVLLAISSFVFAQDDKAASGSEGELNCYDKYEKVLNVRGCDEVGDGWHNNVIITIRNGQKAECFSGKAEVKEGKIESMWFKFEDGTFEQVVKKYKQSFKPTVSNGISRTLITFDYEQVNVIFIDKIKPKKKEYAKPPDPINDL